MGASNLSAKSTKANAPRETLMIPDKIDPSEPLGSVLKETYRLERLIGIGGMGAVYEAAHLRLARRFAVKILFSRFAKNRTVLARFQQEAEITSGLGHPNIVEVVDFNYTPNGLPFIVMELLEGESLAQRLRHYRGPVVLDEVAMIIGQTCSALQAAHDSGIVHRDLKPQNIFLCRRRSRDDVVKLVDFGISKVQGSDLTAVNQPKALLGSPRYMAPEQLEAGQKRIDKRTDIYALGTICYEMLAGKNPFDGDSIPEMLSNVIHHTPPSLDTLVGALVNPGLADVVSRAMSKDRAERHLSVRAFWDAFRAAIGRESLPDLADQLSDESLDEDSEIPTPGHWRESYSQAKTTPALQLSDADAQPPRVASPDTRPVREGELTAAHPEFTYVGPATHEAGAETRSGRSAWVAAASAGATLLVASIAAALFWPTEQQHPTTPGAKGPEPTGTNVATLRTAEGVDMSIAPATDSTTAAKGPTKDAEPGPDAAISTSPPARLTSRRLWIQTVPAGAEVYLDGDLIGVTPLRGVSVPTRRLKLRLALDGHRRRTVRLAAGIDDLHLRRWRLSPRANATPATQRPPSKPPTPQTTAKKPTPKQGWILEPKFD